MTLRINLEIGDYSYSGDDRLFEPIFDRQIEISAIGNLFENSNLEQEAIILVKNELKRIKNNLTHKQAPRASTQNE